MPPIDDDPELRLFFLDEAEALAESILGILQRFLNGDASESAFEELRRGFHTLKGGAAQMSGCDSLYCCAEKAERLAQGIQRRLVVASPALLGLLADAARANVELISAARMSGVMPAYSLQLRERLERANQRVLEADRRAMSADGPAPLPQLIDDAV